VFDLVPLSCNDHISSTYAQLRRPQIDFHSFWDVYNQLHDAVDAEFLFHSSTSTFPEEHVSVPEDNLDITELPLPHLRPCQFGENGVPVGQIVDEGEAECCLAPPLASNRLFLLRSAGVSCRAPGGRIRYGTVESTYTSAHISLDDNLIGEFMDDEADEIF